MTDCLTQILKGAAIAASASAMAASLLPNAALAAPNAGNSYQVTARVPLACWVTPVTAMVSDISSTGQVIEACNAPGGFTVAASYRTLATHETARLVYGTKGMSLDKSGYQILRRSDMATIKKMDYRFEDVELDSPIILSLTIKPI